MGEQGIRYGHKSAWHLAHTKTVTNCTHHPHLKRDVGAAADEPGLGVPAVLLLPGPCRARKCSAYVGLSAGQAAPGTAPTLRQHTQVLPPRLLPYKPAAGLAARLPCAHLPVGVAARHLRVVLDDVDHQAQPLEPVAWWRMADAVRRQGRGEIALDLVCCRPQRTLLNCVYLHCPGWPVRASRKLHSKRQALSCPRLGSRGRGAGSPGSPAPALGFISQLKN